jgi:MarR family transcriptional regulator, 2-MHQ and catechol-resistance regulon repressor
MPTHYQGTPEEELALDTMIKFTRANSSFETRMLSHGSLGELTLSQFGVLEILYHLGPVCQGTLSQKLLKSSGNITLVLDNLEKHGLVRRIRSLEDRRMVMLELTAAGSELIARIFPQHVAIIVEEMSVLTPAEQRLLGELSKKLGISRGKPLPTTPVSELNGSGI